MSSIFTPQVLLPIGFLLLQALFFFFLGIFMLKRFKIIKMPLAGLEYSNVIVAGAALFGTFYITTADTQAVFQAYKTYQNLQHNLFVNSFPKFSQFFLVIFFLEMLYGVLAAAIIKLLLGFKSSVQEIHEGNIPGSIFMALLIISVSILLKNMGQEMMVYLTPQFVGFR